MIRTIELVLLLLAGSGSLFYGLFFHGATVEETKQREVSVAVSTMGGMDESPPEKSGGSESAPPETRPEAKSGADSDEVDPFQSPPPSKGEKLAGDAVNPFESPADAAGLPGVKYEKITEDYVEVHEEPEWVLCARSDLRGRRAAGQWPTETDL